MPLSDKASKSATSTRLEDAYDGCTTEIKLPNDPITIPIRRGVRQGDTVSPKLFTAALEEVFKQLNWEKRRNCGLSIGDKQLSHLRFADDIVLDWHNQTGRATQTGRAQQRQRSYRDADQPLEDEVDGVL